MKPLVSVIVPLYNKGSFVTTTIQSVLRQTYENFELIIVNAGSTDDSLQRVQCISDHRVKVINIERAHPAVVRNKGFECSAGEYVAFLDADDLWLKTKLETHVAALQANPEAASAFSLVTMIDESGNILAIQSPYSPPTDWHIAMLHEMLPVCGSNCLYTRSSLLLSGLFDTNLLCDEDWDLCLRLSRKSSFVLVQTPLVCYRQSTGQWSLNVQSVYDSAQEILMREVRDSPTLSNKDLLRIREQKQAYIRNQCLRILKNPNSNKDTAKMAARVLLKLMPECVPNNVIKAAELHSYRFSKWLLDILPQRIVSRVGWNNIVTGASLLSRVNALRLHFQACQLFLGTTPLPVSYWTGVRACIARFVRVEDPLLSAPTRSRPAQIDDQMQPKEYEPDLHKGTVYFPNLHPVEIDLLRRLMKNLEPKRILEFGTGVTTLFFSTYLSKRKEEEQTLLVSLDPGKELVEVGDLMLAQNHVEHCARIVHLSPSQDGTYDFSRSIVNDEANDSPFDLLVIHGWLGPPGSFFNALPHLARYCRPNALWILTPAFRDGELQLIQERKAMPGLQVDGIYPLMKGMAIGRIIDPSKFRIQ
jgi:glycosyltransferase involved in cell wall biosynthesis/predicted O-methyltransferase YrrM